MDKRPSIQSLPAIPEAVVFAALLVQIYIRSSPGLQASCSSGQRLMLLLLSLAVACKARKPHEP